MRTQKTVGGAVTKYLYSGSQLLLVDTGTTASVWILTDGAGEAIGMAASTDLNYQYSYMKNPMGDIIGIMDRNGDIVCTYEYDAWGKITAITGNTGIANANPLRYRGYVYDAETGLYYCGSRYYDPAVGRFISGDELIDTGTGVLGYNMYAYCNNNPVNLSDPTGQAPGDPFLSADDAAEDFARNYNQRSIDESREYITYIFRRWYTVLRTKNGKSYVTSEWLYTYAKPKKGKETSSTPPLSMILFKTVAIAHTHGSYKPDYYWGNDGFSDGDIKASKFFYRKDAYVAGPSGILYKYDYKTEETTLVTYGLPFDPNAWYPGFSWENYK